MPEEKIITIRLKETNIEDLNGITSILKNQFPSVTWTTTEVIKYSLYYTMNNHPISNKITG